MSADLIALNAVEKYEQKGLPWKSEDAARWTYRKREEYGLSGAFIRIGRRVFIDPVKFHELAREHGTT